MNRYIKLTFFILSVSVAQAVSPEEILPSNRLAPYTFEEISTAVTPYLQVGIIPFYERSLTALFSMGEPKHPNTTIVQGWQCLLKKILATKDEEEQKSAMLDILAMHKGKLEDIDEDLYKQAQAHAPCPNCMQSARGGLF